MSESQTPKQRLEQLRRELGEPGLVSNSALSTPSLIQKHAESAILISQIAEESTKEIICLTRKLFLYTVGLFVLTFVLLLVEIRGMFAERCPAVQNQAALNNQADYQQDTNRSVIHK